MPPVAAKSKAKAPTRADLCRELLQLRVDNGPAFDRIEAIKTELKSIAGKDGKFRETFVGIGYVSVSPESGPKFKGDFPVVNVEAWKALKPARQQTLLEGGVIKIEAQYSGAYYGAVTVKLHNEGAEA
jgi:hypothetical protein